MKMAVAVLAVTALVIPTAANADPANVAGSMAQELGTVESSSAETSTLEGAEGTPVTAGPLGVGRRPVQVYTYTGSFIGKGFSRPLGSHPEAIGHRLRIVVDQATGKLLEREISDLSPALATTAKVRRHRARAAWNKGSACQYSAGEGKYHCYDQASWYMSNSGEKVKGSELQDETTYMLVPEGGKGIWAINNEEWVSFPEKENSLGYYWIENGVTAGEIDEISLHWFVAWNRAGGYGETFGWPEEGWRYVNFSLQAKGSAGEWCSWIDGNLAHCVTGLAQYSKELTVGTEYVTPWTPVDNFNEQTNYTPATSNTRVPWNKVTEYAKAEETYRIGCTREVPPLKYYPGNYSFYVPSWAHNANC
jgi:hypothetical protein